MTFSQLLAKLIDGETLTAGEKQTMLLEAQRMQDAASLLNSIVTPGTSALIVQRLEIQGGDVVVDDAGIFVKNNAEAALSFEDADGVRGTIYIVTGLNNELALVNTKEGGEIILKQTVTGETNSSSYLRLYDDPAQPGRTLVEVRGGLEQENRFILGGGRMDFRTEKEDGTSGSTFWRVRETSGTPEDPGIGTAIHVYMKDDKLIVQFNDGGTLRYKYLDLTGTGVTWVHSTTAP